MKHKKILASVLMWIISGCGIMDQASLSASQEAARD